MGLFCGLVVMAGVWNVVVVCRRLMMLPCTNVDFGTFVCVVYFVWGWVCVLTIAIGMSVLMGRGCDVIEGVDMWEIIGRLFIQSHVCVTLV